MDKHNYKLERMDVECVELDLFKVSEMSQTYLLDFRAGIDAKIYKRLSNEAIFRMIDQLKMELILRGSKRSELRTLFMQICSHLKIDKLCEWLSKRVR